MKRFWVAALLLCFLPGCYRRVAQVAPDVAAAAEVFEARHADLPFPLGSVISIDPEANEYSEQEQSRSLVCSYTIAQSISFLIAFYHKEMERWGWQELLASGSDEEYMLVFQKPGKRCVAIYISPQVKNRRAKKNTISSSHVLIFLQ